MFYLAQKRQNEADRRHWEVYLEESRARREQYHAEQAENEQRIIALLERNIELSARLLELLERRPNNGSASAPADTSGGP